MSKRTKIYFVAEVVVIGGFVLFRTLPAKRDLSVEFVRYNGRADATLRFINESKSDVGVFWKRGWWTNRGTIQETGWVYVSSNNVHRALAIGAHQTNDVRLHSVRSSSHLEPMLELQYYREPSKMRLMLEDALARRKIHITDWRLVKIPVQFPQRPPDGEEARVFSNDWRVLTPDFISTNTQLRRAR